MDLVAEILEVLHGQAVFEKGPGIVARGGVALEIHQVPAPLGVTAAEKMVEAHLVEGGDGGIGGNVPADAVFHPVGPNHHGHGVPPDDALDAPFDFPAAGVDRLLLQGDGVDVGGAGRKGEANAAGLGAVPKRFEKTDHPVRVALVDHVVERLDPLGQFDRFNGRFRRWGRRVVFHVPLLAMMEGVGIVDPDLCGASQPHPHPVGDLGLPVGGHGRRRTGW